jgi:hypothetical protein
VRNVLGVALVVGISGCALDVGEAGGGVQGAAAAPGIHPSENVVSAPLRTELEPELALGAARPEFAFTDEPEQPGGVVVDGNRVMTEAQAARGLVGKADAFTWYRLEYPDAVSQGIRTLRTELTSTHVCVLTLVWGTLWGNGVDVIKYPNEARWNMRVNQTTPRVTGKTALDSVCYPLNAFIINQGGRSMSETFGAYFPGTGSQTVLTWWGDAATYLSGVGGNFASSAERAWITQSTVSDVSSSLSLTSNVGLGHHAYAYSLFVGVPGGTHVSQFIGPNGVGSASVAGEYSVSYDPDDVIHANRARMAHSSEAMCYLTSISGDFRDRNEWVQIIDDADGFWTLRAAAHDGVDEDGAFTRAKARCLRLRQTAGQ